MDYHEMQYRGYKIRIPAHPGLGTILVLMTETDAMTVASYKEALEVVNRYLATGCWFTYH